MQHDWLRGLGLAALLAAGTAASGLSAQAPATRAPSVGTTSGPSAQAPAARAPSVATASGPSAQAPTARAPSVATASGPSAQAPAIRAPTAADTRAASATSQTPAPRPVSIDDILELRQVGAPDISPDGTQIVYALGGWEHPDAKSDSVRGDRHESRSHLWLIPSAGGEPRQLTRGERSESAAAWSPDGRQLAFLSARGTGTDAVAQVWLLPMTGGEARQLTRSRESVASFVWSPDGSRIAYVTQDTLSTAAAAKRRRQDDAQVYESNFRQNHIWVQELQPTSATSTSGASATEIAHGEFTVRGVPSWSPDGTQLVFAASATPLIRDLGGAIYVATVATREVRKLAAISHSPATVLGQPQWSPDGHTISYVTVPEVQRVNPDSMLQAELNYSRLMLHDVASGRAREAFDPVLLVEIGNLTWSRDSRRLIFAASEGAYQGVYEYDVPSDRFTRIAGDLLLGGFSFSRDGSRVALALQTSSAPTDIYLADASFGNRRKLTDANPQVRQRSLGETRVLDWKSSDGTAVQGVLLLPVGYRAGQKYPLLVEVHGGPTGSTSAGFKASASSPGQYWAGRGWAVLYPNPRGSTAYGQTFMRGNIPDWGGGDYRDIMTGVDELIRQGIADSARTAILGWSYGGYMTAWVVSQTARFKAARMGAGMSDVASMYGTTDIPGYIGIFFGGPPSAASRELYLERSPLTHAHRVTTPLLILHGAGDERVPPGQALQYYRALKDAGKTVQLVLYPRAGHALRDYYHLIDRIQREYDWIARYTLGESATSADRQAPARRAGDSAAERSRPEAAHSDRQAPARRASDSAAERSRPEAARRDQRVPDRPRAVSGA